MYNTNINLDQTAEKTIPFNYNGEIIPALIKQFLYKLFSEDPELSEYIDSDGHVKTKAIEL